MKYKTQILLSRIGRTYSKIENWRIRGTGWKDTLWGWLSINSIKDAILVGGVAKLSMFPDLPMWTFIFIIFIAGIFIELIKILIGFVDYKFGIWEKQADWAQSNAVISPWNRQTEDTLKEVCKKLEIKHKYNERE